MFRKLALASTAVCLLATSSCSMLQGPPGPSGPPGPVSPAPTPLPVTAQMVASDIGLMASGLNDALSQPSVMALIPADIQPKITQALADLRKLASDVSIAPSSSVTKATVTSVESLVNTIVNSLASLPLPPPVPTILTAASVLLPVIEAAVGVLVPAAEARAKAATRMTASQARAHLASVH